MKAFLDTSVLVATFYGDHEHHEKSLDPFLRFGRVNACCGLHSLAEVYATLTRMPGPRRTAPKEALLFLADIRENLAVVGIDESEYASCLAEAAANGIVGGAVYDALLAHCALKAGAEAIYTWNPKDFLRLSESVASLVKQPGTVSR